MGEKVVPYHREALTMQDAKEGEGDRALLYRNWGGGVNKRGIKGMP